jgi:hypothetical protein
MDADPDGSQSPGHLARANNLIAFRRRKFLNRFHWIVF